MKKLIAIILSITIICAFIACESTNQKQSDVEKYSYLTFEIDDENECVTVTGYDKKTIPDQLVIPDSIDGYPITKIAKSAFADCKTITSVTVPDNVDEIEDKAFQSCASLKSARLPNGLAEISPYLFFNCASLENVNIPKNVTVIGDAAFSGCGKLKYVRLPDALLEIGEGAFSECFLLSVTLPQNVKLNFRTFGCDCLGGIHNDYCGVIIDGSQLPSNATFGRYTTVFATFGETPLSWLAFDQFYQKWYEFWTESGVLVYRECALKVNENGDKYVYSVHVAKYKEKDKNVEYFSIPDSGKSFAAALPYRDGYAFLGWATTEGKTTPDYTFVSTKYTPAGGSSSQNVMGTLPDSDEEEIIPLGTTLYTVWQKLPD